jgi:hypothetical protein
MQIIEITVAPDGSTRIETRGFAGASCRQASASIEHALGQRTGEQLTSEFYAPIIQPQTLQEGQ